ncbi:MAG: tryptophan synthase subunit alpha [Planctomycetota bacterium]
MSLALLQQALAEPRRHVSAFLVLGDPDPTRSVALARAAVATGSTMLELGLPFADACADGPAIQAASLRARTAGTSTSRAIALLAEVRAACPDVPLNLLVYGNLVHRRGYTRFCDEVARAGASSLLVPDVPHEESDPLRAACAHAGLGFVPLVGPHTDRTRLQDLDAASTAFLYLAGLQGVTGATTGQGDRRETTRRVAASVSKPVCLGFGLSAPAHIRDAFAAGARIAVVGSHLARAIAHGCVQPDGVEPHFVAALRPLVAAAHTSPSASDSDSDPNE